MPGNTQSQRIANAERRMKGRRVRYVSGRLALARLRTQRDERYISGWALPFTEGICSTGPPVGFSISGTGVRRRMIASLPTGSGASATLPDAKRSC